MAQPLIQRKKDLLYLTYFSIAIPIAFIVDLEPIYPVHLIPQFMTDIKEYYIAGWRDQNFITPTPTFLGFIWSEALIQVPVMIWGWKALRQGNPKLPLVLLPFSCLIFISTGSLMVEHWSWPISFQEKLDLTFLYGPYLALSALMFFDMFFRLSSVIQSKTVAPVSDVQRKRL